MFPYFFKLFTITIKMMSLLYTLILHMLSIVLLRENSYNVRDPLLQWI